MKFVVKKETLSEALQKAQSVVEKKNTVHILSNVLLSAENNTLSLTATDLEVGINIRIQVETLESGKIAISAKNLLDIVKELPDKPVTITKKNNNWIELSCHKSTFNLAGLSAEEFPPQPEIEGKDFFNINSATAREMIDRTLFSVSTDETRYHLNGVYLEILDTGLVRMVSTDGHRLSLIDKELLLQKIDTLKGVIKDGIIIPKKGLMELRKTLDSKTETFSMALDKGTLMVKIDNICLNTRLIEGQYPDYEQVIPKSNNKHMTVNREDLLGSLRRVSLLANEKSKGVKFAISENQLTITSSNSDLGDAKEELDVDYNQEALEIGFNARYIIECLSILDTEKVVLTLNDKLSPGVIRPKGKDDYAYIVMPMRI